MLMAYHIDTGLIKDKFKVDCECPLCEIKQVVEEQFLHEFLNDAVMEDNTRIKVGKLGFCDRHFDMLFSRQNKLSVALQIRTRIDVLKDRVLNELKNANQAGKTAKEIAEILEEEKKKIIIVALVDTLEYLKKGGRVSKTVAFAGGLLNIKPVLSVTQGEINMLGKARGSKMGNNLLIEEISKAGGIDFSKPVLLGYSGISDALLLKYIEDSRHIWEGNLNEVRYTSVGSVIGTHAGPGAVVVAFFKN